MADSSSSSPSFSDFPNDVQINILSFLNPTDISAFACTSRHFSLICSPSSPSSKALYHSICLRRWGSQTLIPNWTSDFALLHRTLDKWAPLIGFWRQIGTPMGVPPLLLFEWGPNSITASRVLPSRESGSFGVVKMPFLWMGISKNGEAVSYLKGLDEGLVSVSVSFIGGNNLVVEESGGDLTEEEMVGSPEDREIYEYFANRRSPRMRKRKDGRRRKRWEAEHFVRIGDYCPTQGRPLQGLWKGICESMDLDFYLVTYDDVGGITCRRVGDSGEPLSGAPVFWTSNATFLNSPFSKEEQDLYSSRYHVAPNHSDSEPGVVSRILCINSSYDLVLPNLSGASANPRNVEGRIWEYENGTFGFGFLRNKFIVDLKHIVLDGAVLDTMEDSCSSSSPSSSSSP